MRSIALVLEFELRSLLGSRGFLAQMIFLEPLAYLILLGGGLSGIVVGGGSQYINFIYPGIIGFQVLRLFSYSTYRLTVERRWGILAIKVAGGVSRFSYLCAMLIPPVALFTTQLLVSAPVAILMGVKMDLLGIFGLLVAGIVSSVFWTSLALLGAFAFRNYAQRDMWLAFLMLPLSLSAPVFYSLKNAPSYLQMLSRLNPLTYQVQSMRSLFLGEPSGYSILLSLCASIVLLIGAYLILIRSELLSRE